VSDARSAAASTRVEWRERSGWRLEVTVERVAMSLEYDQAVHSLVQTRECSDEQTEAAEQWSGRDGEPFAQPCQSHRNKKRPRINTTNGNQTHINRLRQTASIRGCNSGLDRFTTAVGIVFSRFEAIFFFFLFLVAKA
jgi:hypothetical protein